MYLEEPAPRFPEQLITAHETQQTAQSGWTVKLTGRPKNGAPPPSATPHARLHQPIGLTLAWQQMGISHLETDSIASDEASEERSVATRHQSHLAGVCGRRELGRVSACGINIV